MPVICLKLAFMSSSQYSLNRSANIYTYIHTNTNLLTKYINSAELRMTVCDLHFDSNSAISNEILSSLLLLFVCLCHTHHSHSHKTKTVIEVSGP